MSALIAPFASVISGAEAIATPLVKDAVNQKYGTAKKERIAQLQNILNLPDSLTRPQQLQQYFQQLCVDGGTPARGLGENISVPMDFIEALATIAIDKIYDDQTISTLQGQGK